MMLRAAVFVHLPNSLKFHKRIQPSFYILFLFHSETFEGPQGTYQEVGPGCVFTDENWKPPR